MNSTGKREKWFYNNEHQSSSSVHPPIHSVPPTPNAIHTYSLNKQRIKVFRSKQGCLKMQKCDSSFHNDVYFFGLAFFFPLPFLGLAFFFLPRSKQYEDISLMNLKDVKVNCSLLQI